MKEITTEQVRILYKDKTPSVPEGLEACGAAAQAALRFHRSMPAYRETALVPLSAAARRYGVGGIYVKDESSRFGLNAFKGLGGSYSMFRILCDRLGLDPAGTDFRDFQRPEVREACREIVFVTATDGNHGKGVSWAAKLFGCQAHVYLPAGSVEARRRAIEEAGSADARITGYNYDETVAYANALAEKNGWILIQDTSWAGYEAIPRWIVEGYMTLAAETADQLGGTVPTHVFLQAGVGAMAGGVAAYLLDRWRNSPPVVAVVEPEEAACICLSAQAEDGIARSVTGNPETIMAGLNCGTPCGITWPVLRDGAALYCACGDSVAEDGMRAYAHPLPGDRKVVSGESGAVTYGLLRKVLQDDALREVFHIRPDSVILLISTEGDTDPEGYRRIVG